MKKIILFLVLFLTVGVFGHDLDDCEIYVGDLDSSMVDPILDSAGLGSVWIVIADSIEPKPDPTWIYSIYYIDTTGFRKDSTHVQVGCPEGHIGCLVYHWGWEVKWVPILDTTYITRNVLGDYHPPPGKKLLVGREKSK